MLSFLILGILLISVFWQYKKFVIIGFCILFLVLGIWRHQVALLKIENNELRKFNDLNQNITLIGIVSGEPDIREKSLKITIKVNESLTEDGPRTTTGKVLVTTNRYPEYQYGDKLKISGKLKTPLEFEDFNYKDYLAKDGIYSVIYLPKIELLEKNQGNLVYAKILEFKNKLRESIEQNLSPPQSSILGAMILGDKRKLSEDLKTKLNIAGVRHITAISGLHITILTSILMTILIGLGLWRQQAFYFSIILMTLFIIMTGLQPSAIRAGIMGGLFLLAQYLGRMSVSSRAIVFAAAVMLAINPLLLKLDIGFQLSFLAVMGIIYLGPFLREWFSSSPEAKGILEDLPKEFKKFITHFYGVPYYFFAKVLGKNKTIISTAAMTLGAQFFTLPILIYNFGYVSVSAPITNLLVVPLLPFIMISGFIFGLAGMIFQPLGWVLSWISWLLLTYLIKIVDFFSQMPPAYFKDPWAWLVIFYLTFGVLTWKLNEKQKLKFLEY